MAPSRLCRKIVLPSCPRGCKQGRKESEELRVGSSCKINYSLQYSNALFQLLLLSIIMPTIASRENALVLANQRNSPGSFTHVLSRDLCPNLLFHMRSLLARWPHKANVDKKASNRQ